MEMYLVQEDKLKVVLTKKDVERLGLGRERLDYTNESTRRVLIDMLERGRDEVGFYPRRSKLYIEVYPAEDGGSVLYFTRLHGSATFPMGRLDPGPHPVVFAFGEVEDLITACCKVSRQYGHRIYKSTLYKFGHEHRLIVYPLDYADRLSIRLLSEYGRLVGEGALPASLCEEHGTLITGDNAIDQLAQAME